MTVVK